MRVARMAEAAGYVCTPHISGTGLGYLYMMQFVSAIPNAGPYHEYKGLAKDIPIECKSSSLKVENGEISVPKESGDGIDIDPDYVAKHELVEV
jgi:L-alanine-DL-glutamate epimerase-like enolase superfamily enzyme